MGHRHKDSRAKWTTTDAEPPIPAAAFTAADVTKLLAIARGTSGGGTTPVPNDPPPPPPPDMTAPTIPSFTITAIAGTTATFNATTNEASTVVFRYGLTTAYGTATAATASGTSHSKTVTGLTAGRTYHVRAEATDTAGNGPTLSSDRVFNTPAPSGTAVIAYFPGSGSNSGAALLALMANMSIDEIEIAAGTYLMSNLRVNVNRTSRPLTIRLAGPVTFTKASSGGLFYFGYGGVAAHITMEFAQATFSGFTIGDTGIVWMGNCHHISVKGPTVQSITTTGDPVNAWACYLSIDAGVSPSNISLPDWTVTGTNKNFGGLQIGHPPSTISTVSATGWAVNQVAWALYAYGTVTGLTVDDWAISNSRIAAANVTVNFAAGVSGTYSNMVGTSSGGLQGAGGMTDGGGNSL